MIQHTIYAKYTNYTILCFLKQIQHIKPWYAHNEAMNVTKVTTELQ